MVHHAISKCWLRPCLCGSPGCSREPSPDWCGLRAVTEWRRVHEQEQPDETKELVESAAFACRLDIGRRGRTLHLPHVCQCTGWSRIWSIWRWSSEANNRPCPRSLGGFVELG